MLVSSWPPVHINNKWERESLFKSGIPLIFYLSLYCPVCQTAFFIVLISSMVCWFSSSFSRRIALAIIAPLWQRIHAGLCCALWRYFYRQIRFTKSFFLCSGYYPVFAVFFNLFWLSMKKNAFFWNFFAPSDFICPNIGSNFVVGIGNQWHRYLVARIIVSLPPLPKN